MSIWIVFFVNKLLGRNIHDGPKAPQGREIAEKLGLKETDVDNAFRLAKQKFERIFRDELLNVCADTGSFEQEVANLLALLAPAR